MDGVYLLRKRRHTRLWYRAMPATAQPPLAQPAMISGTDLLVHAAAAAEPRPAPAPARAVAAPPVAPTPDVPAPVVAAPVLPESLRQTKRPGQPQPAAKETAARATAPVSGGEDEEHEWRLVPATAPSLLLSANDLLDARNPGPVLRPGCRYRIAGVQNGVVGLYVTDPDGQTGLGFCAAVDLICIDGRFHRFRAGRTPNVDKHPFRARMQRLTGGLSQATTSLLGAASHGSR